MRHSMQHQNHPALRKKNTNFATQHIFNTLTVNQENDYGKSINLDSIDFQLVVI